MQSRGSLQISEDEVDARATSSAGDREEASSWVETPHESPARAVPRPSVQNHVTEQTQGRGQFTSAPSAGSREEASSWVETHPECLPPGRGVDSRRKVTDRNKQARARSVHERLRPRPRGERLRPGRKRSLRVVRRDGASTLGAKTWIRTNKQGRGRFTSDCVCGC